ncbi:MAG: FAD-dependent oxidoreductase [Paludibacter sp.]|nr:FAD-dependent oxidoreductase [Paludibacter sp.]
MLKENKYDIIVCGGGPSGVAAAIAAARRGAKTLLIERYGFCGGMSTSALVNPWSGQEYVDPETNKRGSLIEGVFKEVVLKMHTNGGFGTSLAPSAFDEELLKYIYDTLLSDAGVHVRYHSYVQSVQKEGDRIASIGIASKEGIEVFCAQNFIDCTGDADVAAMAGVPFEVGRQEDGLTQAMTVSFRMGNVDKEDMIATGNFRAARALVEPYFQKALSKGELHYPYRNFIHFYDYPRPNILHFNMTRITEVSGLSAIDLTKAEIEGRRQAFLIGNWLIKSTPWFKNAYIEKIACQVGVRETRHIKGLYTITSEDIIKGQKFTDGIARSRYFIDIHNPTGAIDIQQIPGEKGAVKPNFGPPPGDYYEIPFRSLLNNVCPNVIVPCRALSATHEAAAAIRVMATMHAIGEAAGIAVAESVRQNTDVLSISGEWVRKQIPYLSKSPDLDKIWNSNA